MYSDLFLKKNEDGILKFGIRKNIDNIYEYPNVAVDEKIAISFLPGMLFPEYELIETKQKQFFPRKWPFTSVVYIDTLFILKPKVESSMPPVPCGCELFARF